MDAVLMFAISIVVFLYSVILHEVAHGWVANRLGDDTARISGRLSLNPMVHIDPIGSLLLPVLLFLTTGFAFGYAKPVPVNSIQLAGGRRAYRLVALAGIATNLAIAIVAGLVVRLAVGSYHLPDNNLGVIFFVQAFLLNIVLAVFNAIPLPGFDGFNFLNTFTPVSNFVNRTPLGNPQFMATYGMIISFALLLIFWSPIGGIISTAIGFFAGLLGI